MNLQRTTSAIIRQQPDEDIKIQNQVYFDTPDYTGVLAQLNTIPKTKKAYNVRRHIVMAHGGIHCNSKGNYSKIKVPNNIIVMLMGKVGNVSLGTGLEELQNICNEKLIPRYIYTPGTMLPDLTLSSEYNVGGISGVFECSNHNTRLAINNLLLPKPQVIMSYYNDYSQRNQEMIALLNHVIHRNDGVIEGNIHTASLGSLFERISKILNNNEYSFLYIISCLSDSSTVTITQDQLSRVSGANTKKGVFHGNTLYRIPERIETFVGHIKINNKDIKIRLTGDNAMTYAKNQNHKQYRDFLVTYINNSNISELIDIIYRSGNLEAYYDENFRPFLEAAQKNHKNYIDDVAYDNRYILIINFLTTHASIIMAIMKNDVNSLAKLATRKSALKNGVSPQKYNAVSGKINNDAMRYSHILTIVNDPPSTAAANMQKILKNTHTLNISVDNAMYDTNINAESLKYEIWAFYLQNPYLYTDILFLNVQTRILNGHYIGQIREFWNISSQKEYELHQIRLQQISHVLIFMKLLFTIIDNENEVMPSLSSLLQNNDHIYTGIFNIPNLQQQIVNANLIDNNDKPDVVMQNIANLLSNINSIEYAATLINNAIQNNQNDQISQLIQNNVNNYVPINAHFNDDYYDDNSMDLSGGNAGDDAGDGFLTSLFKFFGF